MSFKRAVEITYIAGSVISLPYILDKNLQALCKGGNVQFHEVVYTGALLPLVWPLSLPLTISGALPGHLESRSENKEARFVEIPVLKKQERCKHD